ncbi:MAG: glycogen/starch synthase [Gammaproteobacteria bacterium]
MHIGLVAAENDALPGGKVGGLGDVIRDLPIGLAKAGHEVSVITPGYGIFATGGEARELARLQVWFCGVPENLTVFEVKAPRSVPGVRHIVLEHPLFSAAGAGRIYVDDNAGPFATDAHKFALFCAAVAELLVQDLLPPLQVLHCHDWHAAPLLLLRAFDPRYIKLHNLPAVFTIHNLSLQGVRPLRGVHSALESWFPTLPYQPAGIVDPSHRDCINLMRTGINLADRVHTVSPTYAREILRPSDWSEGIVGGEGLELDLQRAQAEGRLLGILNGCDYESVPEPPTATATFRLIEENLDRWVDRGLGNQTAHYYALKRLHGMTRAGDIARPCLVSIGRLTAQKLYLLIQNLYHRPLMDLLLEQLDKGTFIMLGSGDPDYARFFTRVMQAHQNFLYLDGYSEPLSAALYGFGDLFVMPSIYEPCGISQMLAMRAGVPCLVHQVGGLNDTVINGKNGFSFGGDNLADKQQNLLDTLQQTLSLYRDKPRKWQKIARAAKQSRFTWDTSIDQYLEHLYRADRPKSRRSAAKKLT